jgi:hypothetical protein
MKIILSIPVERVQLTPATHTHRHELMECSVSKVLRRACGSGAASKRYYYSAVLVPPPGMLIVPYMLRDGLYTTGIVRGLNPKWKPPKFEEGSNVFEVG